MSLSKAGLIISVALFAGMVNAPGKLKSDELLALKAGDVVYIRSEFSAKEDVLIKVGKGANQQISYLSGALIPTDTKTSVAELEKAQWVFHECDDDATPWKVNGTYIGANHGASDVVEVTSPAHGLAKSDLGSVWQDEAGPLFNLIEIKGPDALLFLSDNSAAYPSWSFTRQITGSTLTNQKSRAALSVGKSTLTQLYPACRIREQLYLADGETPLRDGVVTACAFLDINEDYDIVAPDAVLQSVKNNPGKAVSFVADGLEAIISNQISYRFLPQGACVIRHKAKALRNLDLAYMGFIQSTSLKAAEDDILEYYIPKTSAFSQDQVNYDFQSVQRFAKPATPLVFSTELGNLSEPGDLPDRFIQFLRRENNAQTPRRIGFAMGYSHLEGLTRPTVRAENTASPLFIHITGKVYPAALDAKSKKVEGGDEFLAVAYRQYFDPASCPGATDVYGHLEGRDYLLYADFHQTVDKCVLPIPRKYFGAKFEVVEKSPSVSLEQEGVIPSGGPVVSVKGDYGRMILRIIGGY